MLGLRVGFYGLVFFPFRSLGLVLNAWVQGLLVLREHWGFESVYYYFGSGIMCVLFRFAILLVFLSFAWMSL